MQSCEFREGVERIYGERLVRLVLFGSQARNDAKPDSDIDVMVVLRGAVRAGEEIERTSFLKADICVKHGVLVSCVYISDDRFRHEQSPLMLNVRREGILFSSSSSFFAPLVSFSLRGDLGFR